MDSRRDPGLLARGLARLRDARTTWRARRRPAVGAAVIAIAIFAAIAGPPAAAAAPPKGVRPTPTPEPTRGSAAKGAASAGDVYWVQVGAFRDPQTARRVAQKLRDQKYPVQESVAGRQAVAPEGRAPRGAADARDRYEVVVAGGSGSDVAATLASKGLTSRAAADGAAVTPSLPLAEAVALSKDLSGDGLAVRVRRAEATGPVSPIPTGGSDGDGLHRVRVGSYTDRAAAEAAMKDLESRGYKPVLTRGTE